MTAPETQGSILPLEPWSDEQIRIVTETLSDVEAAVRLLPEDIQQRHREAQESIIRARRAGERLAPTIWIG